MQAASDMFWLDGTMGTAFLRTAINVTLRSNRSSKFSIRDVLADYGEWCGWALARAMPSRETLR